MGLLIFGVLETVEFTDDSRFCGALCHTVMKPEYVTYQASPHARVPCVECHVGSGTTYFVRSKVTGVPLIMAVLFNSYDRPVGSPVHDLRPARETCEECHWPEKFTRDRLRVYERFSSDEENTSSTGAMVFRMGGAPAARGVHWHIASELWYLPLDEARQEIGWVQVVSPDGSVEEWMDPDRVQEVTPERVQQDKRFFDCVDCHNRATHVFRSPDQLLDQALAAGEIDPALPFVKREGLKVLDVSAPSLEEAWAKAESLPDFYRTSYPDVYATKGPEIAKAVDTLKDLTELAIFPEMRATWQTHLNNLSHEGCFRCHGKLVSVVDRQESTPIDSSCILCHFQLQTSLVQAIMGGEEARLAQTPGVPHAAEGHERCLVCHESGFGGATRVPEDHVGRPNDTCLSCHVVAPGTPVIPAPNVPHRIGTQEQCLACHRTGVRGASTIPADHSGRPADICLLCHGPTPIQPPDVPHAVEGRGACLACHETGVDSTPPVTLSHLGRSDDSCRSCHGVASPAVPISAPAMPHGVERQRECLACHRTGVLGASLVPPDHARATVSLCLLCHVASSVLPPDVPHVVEGLAECLACHENGLDGAARVPVSHEEWSRESCVACHVLAASPTPLSAPLVPHDVERQRDCVSCHGTGAMGAAVVPADHAGVAVGACLLCHGATVARTPSVPHPVAALRECLACHGLGVDGAARVPEGHAGWTVESCLACHARATPSTPIAAPGLPHGVARQQACLACHGTGAMGASLAPADHAGVGVGACLLCHAAPAVEPAEVRHPVAGLGDCLACHRAGVVGAPAVPASHAGRSDVSCLACHAASSAAAPLEGPAVPHQVAGREACLACHAAAFGGAPAAPADHSGVVESACALCHAEAAQVAPIAAPAVPHAVDGREQCLLCHATGVVGAPRVPAGHPVDSPQVCLLCHARE